MFSTSVLECRKSLDREAPRRGLFAWDKENRPSDANKEPKVRELCEEPRRVQLEEEKQDLQRQLRDAHQGRKAAEAKAQKLQLVLRGSVASEQLAGLHQLQQQMRQISGHMTLQEEQLQCLTNRRLASWAVHRAVVRGLLKQPPSAEAPQDAQKAPSEEELARLRAELAEAQAEAEVRKKCSREVQGELLRDCEAWQRRAEALERLDGGAGCGSCGALLAEAREMGATVAALQEQCKALEVENKSLKGKVASLQENLAYVSSSHAELAGHANHRQKIRHTVQLKEDRDSMREENYRLKQRILQLEAGRSSRCIVEAVAGFTGAPELKNGARTARATLRPRMGDKGQSLESHCQQLERELERNKNNVLHFMALIERGVSRESGDAAALLSVLRQRFLG